MFTAKQHPEVLLSQAANLAWLAIVIWSINAFGFLPVFRTFLAPWAIYHHYLVLISFLNHSDPKLPHWEVRDLLLPLCVQ